MSASTDGFTDEQLKTALFRVRTHDLLAFLRKRGERKEDAMVSESLAARQGRAAGACRRHRGSQPARLSDHAELSGRCPGQGIATDR